MEAEVIPMQRRPEGVTVKGWLQEQMDEVAAKLGYEQAKLQEAEALVTMRDGEYDDAKKAAKEFHRENPDAGPSETDDEEDQAYSRLSQANRAYDDARLAVRRLQHQFDWMSEKIKWMPKEF